MNLKKMVKGYDLVDLTYADLAYLQAILQAFKEQNPDEERIMLFTEDPISPDDPYEPTDQRGVYQPKCEPVDFIVVLDAEDIKKSNFQD